ncbi:UPF0728 protein C10orf53 homolog isoform X2 [Rhinoderma darwinii]|uniref:UPF0728 protein C10orf53 homolog isoform X2 n=1 Tax=Rhinoderma darwinii TaxID=43563 RepID=UPI003F677E6E
MPEKAVVSVRFGPYLNGSGIVEHRVSRLRGLRAVLVSDGHKVVLEETLDRDTVELMVNGETVFQCNIKELDFVEQCPLYPLKCRICRGSGNFESKTALQTALIGNIERVRLNENFFNL